MALGVPLNTPEAPGVPLNALEALRRIHQQQHMLLASCWSLCSGVNIS